MHTQLVLAACLIAAAAAAECGPLERLKVMSQWEEVYGASAEKRETFGKEVWTHIFLHEPKAQELFTRVRGDSVGSHEFRAHAVRVFGGMDICISLLHDEATLNAELSHLHDQHVDRAIPAEYFDAFRHAFMHVMSQHVEHFEQDAWVACFEVIKTGIAG